jgi:hypothetical protein
LGDRAGGWACGRGTWRGGATTGDQYKRQQHRQETGKRMQTDEHITLLDVVSYVSIRRRICAHLAAAQASYVEDATGFGFVPGAIVVLKQVCLSLDIQLGNNDN